VVAAYLSVVLSLATIQRTGARRVAAASLLACAALALVLGLRPGLQGRQGFDRHSKALGVERFQRSPGDVVANWRGRIYASWWFLADATPRLLSADAAETSLRYGSVTVTESESPERLVARALAQARRTGQAWVLLSHFKDKDTQHLGLVLAILQQEIARAADVTLVYVGEAGRDFFPPLISLQLRAAAPDGFDSVAPEDR
jgi:hypothetical protein